MIALAPFIRYSGLLLLALCLGCGCSQKRSVANNPYRQHYVDVTRKGFPEVEGPIRQAAFAHLNRDEQQDLLLLIGGPGIRSKVLVLLNEGGGKFAIKEDTGSLQGLEGDILHMVAGDLDRDRVDDLVLITKESGKSSAKLLFNNKKGYFYFKKEQIFPAVYSGMDSTAVIDLDQDRDLDLLFTGVEVLGTDRRPHRFQTQVLINNGTGRFVDHTRLLMPSLPPGIVGTAFADYDGDGILDVFLVYGNGRNRLLINNGLAQFKDKTLDSLPRIQDESTHADWADFDMDGDNDLLVVNRAIGVRDRSHFSETSYFLENNGRGVFKKRSHKVLPLSPARRVYLLDANGNEIPDALILSKDGTLFLHGKGKWRFTVENNRRLPRLRMFREMAFGDINSDGFLDLFAITTKDGKGRVWLNIVD